MSELTLDSECITHLAEQYIGIVETLTKSLNIAGKDLTISQHALTLALNEAKTDLEVMAVRRKPKKGISDSKIAGILAFRLSRFAPINLSGEAAEGKVAIKLNDLAALALVMKSVLNLNITQVGSSHATKELQYTLARRHMNQETLGLAFELLHRG